MAKTIKVRAHSVTFRVFKGIVRIFKKKPIIFNNNAFISHQSILISNHSGATGPLVLSLFFPSFFVPWGAHPMVGNYRSRWKYLYNIFYQKKLGYKKIRSLVVATLFAIISKMLYRGMRLIPTYEDIRLLKTFRKSRFHLDRHEPILIFPEDSNDGYFEYPKKYNQGFVALSDHYFKHSKIDLPIYPIYYSKKLNAMLIDEPKYVQDMLNQGKSKEDIALYFKELTNSMGQKLKYKLEQ